MTYDEAAAIIQQYYLGYFGRPADPAGLTAWTDLLVTGTPLSEVITFFGNPEGEEFVAIYGTDPTPEEFFTAAYGNILNRAPDAEGVTFWTGVYNAYIDDGMTPAEARGQLVADMLEGVEGGSVFDQATLANQLTLSAETTALAQDLIDEGNTDGANTLINSVRDGAFKNPDIAYPSQLQDAQDDLQQEYNDLSGGGTGGQTFTLTTGADTIPGLIGSEGTTDNSGNDTIVGTETTLGSNDVLDGGAGSEMMGTAATAAAAVNTAGFELQSIETVQITSDAVGGTTFDFTGTTGVETVVNKNSSQNLTITGLGNIVDVALTNVSAGTTNVQFKNAALTGTSDVLNLTLNDVLGNAGDAVANVTIGNSTAPNDTGFETVNITTTGGESKLVGLNTNAPTINVQGDQNLSIAGMLTGTTLVDATGGTGDGATSFSGNLNVVLDSAGVAKDVVVKGGSGDDTADFSAGFEAGDEFWGGDGTDSIGMTNALATGSPAGALNSVEQLLVTTGGTGTIDMDNFPGVTKVIYDAGLAGAATVDDAVSGLTVEVDVTGAAQNLTVDLKADGTTDEVNFMFDEIGAGDVLGTVNADDAETLTVEADDDTNNASGTLTIAALSSKDATKTTFKGDAELTLTTVTNPTTQVLSEVDASGMTDKLTVNNMDMVSTGATVTFGSGGTVWNLGTAAVTGADTFNFGAGADTLFYTAANQSTGTSSDTIKGFTQGQDAINLTNLTGVGAGVITSTQWLGNAVDTTAAESALTAGGGMEAIFVQSEGVLVVDVNDDGNIGAGDLRVIMDGITSMTAADLGLGTAGNNITLTAPNAVVNTTTKTNATNMSTNENDTITTTVANLNGSSIDAALGTDTLRITDQIGAGGLVLSDGGAGGSLNSSIETIELLQGSLGVVDLQQATALAAGGTIKAGAPVSIGLDNGNGAGTNIILSSGADTLDVDVDNAGGGVVPNAGITWDGGDGVDTFIVGSGADYSDRNVINFETLGFSSNNWNVTFSVNQWAGFNSVVGAGGAETLKLSGAGGTIAADATIETYDLSALTSAGTLTLTGATAYTVTASNSGDTIEAGTATGGFMVFTGGTGNDTINTTVANLDASAGALAFAGGTGDALALTGGLTGNLSLAGLTGGGSVTGVETLTLAGASTANTLTVANASGLVTVNASGVTGGGVTIDMSGLDTTNGITTATLTGGDDTLATSISAAGGNDLLINFGTGVTETVTDIANSAGGIIEFDIDAQAGSTTTVNVAATTADFDTNDVFDFSDDVTGIVNAGAGVAGQVIVTNDGADSVVLWDADGNNILSAGDIQVAIVGQVLTSANFNIVNNDLVVA